MTPCAARIHAALARRLLAGAAVLACVVAWGPAAVASTAVYRWVDADGITHLSSDRPPAGVEFERVAVGGRTNRPSAVGRTGEGAPAAVRIAAASPEQVARRNDVISELANRECVVALEAIDRMARSGQPVEAADFRRLQQTADANCSKDPARRLEQEGQAAKLRVAKGDACVAARNALADMLAPGRRPTRDQLRNQQEFIETHCKVPVR